MIPKLVFSDVDGTLLRPDGTLSDRTKSTIEKLKERDIPFTLVSARSPQEMFALYEMLELDSPVVSYNGGLIFEMHNGDMKVLSDYIIQEEESKKIYEIITNEFPSLNINIYSNTSWYAERHDEWLEMEIELVKVKLEFRNLGDVVQSGLPIHKMMLIGPEQTILEAEKTLKANKELTSSINTSSPNYLEITNELATKKNGLQTVVEKFYPDVHIKEVMALGDGYNDWDMLKYAGFGVAMGNAAEEIKQSVKYVTETNADDGLAKAIEKFVLQNL